MASRPLQPGPRDERGVLAARILSVARAQFSENGWAGTTIRSIARAADVDPSLIYHYFGSKESLLDACTTPPPEWLARIAVAWAAPREELGARLVAVTLQNWRAEDSGPTWSPDGTRLAFLSRRSGSYQVWTMNAATGGSLTQVTKLNEPSSPAWAH